MAAAVSRGIGSPMMFLEGNSGSCCCTRSMKSSPVTISTRSGGTITEVRSKVSCNIDLSPNSVRNCFGLSGVDKGQNRVPDPPATIITPNSVFNRFGIFIVLN